MPPKVSTGASNTPAVPATTKEVKSAWGPKGKAATGLANRATGSSTPPAAPETTAPVVEAEGTPKSQSISADGGAIHATTTPLPQLHLDLDGLNNTASGSRTKAASTSEPRPDKALPTAHMLMGRVKGTVRDMIKVVEGQGQGGVKDCDEFIAVLEEATRALKTAKVDAKNSRGPSASGVKSGGGGVPASPSPVPAPKQPVSVVAPTTIASGSVAKSEPEPATSPPQRVSSFKVASPSSPSPQKVEVVRPASPPPSGGPNKSWAALAKGNKTPTKEKAASLEQERKVLAARGAERQGDAEAKRKQLEYEKKGQADATMEKVEKAKERREAVVETQRQSQTIRHDGAVKRADEKIDERKKKAETQNNRVDEVVTIQALVEDSKVAELANKEEERTVANEQRTLVQQERAKERADAHNAVLEKGKELADKKAAELQKKNDLRDEAKRKIDEAKKAELDARLSKSEQRLQKVAENKEKAQEETDAKLKKAEDRVAQSIKLREEQQAAVKQKAAKEVGKLQKVKERRGDKSGLQSSVLSQLAEEVEGLGDDPLEGSAVEDAAGVAGSSSGGLAEVSKAQQKINRVSDQVQRQAALYVEGYVESASKGHKDLNKTKLRGALQRLQNTTTSTSATGVRACLHEVLGFCGGINEGSFADLDQEFMRFNDLFKVVIESATQAHRAMPRDLVSFRMATDIVRRLLLDPVHGEINIDFFLQSGGLLPFIQLMADEIRAVKGHKGPANLGIGVSLTFVQASLGRLLDSSCKLSTLRDQTMDLLAAAGVWNYSLAIAQATLRPSEMPSLLASLGVLAQGLPIVAKRKAPEEKAEWLRKIVEALLNLMNSVLCPSGSPMRSQQDLTPAATAVMFIAIRILNTVARHDIPFLQSLVSPPPSMATSPSTSPIGGAGGSASSLHHEMFHMVAAFVNYLCDHPGTTLESLSSVSLTHVKAQMSPALKDGFKFGLTEALPPPPVLTPGDSGPEGTPRQLQTPKRTANKTYLRASIHEMLLFVGYISVMNEPVQELFSFSSGDRPLLSTLLNAIPIQYFAGCRVALFPALVALSYNNAKNVEIMQREMELDELKEFLEEEMVLLKKKGSTSTENTEKEKQKEGAKTKAKAEKKEAKEAEKKKTAAAEQSTKKLVVTRSWVDMMEDEDDGVSFDDPLAGPGGFTPLSKVGILGGPAWANKLAAGGNAQSAESVISAATTSAASDGDTEALLGELQREERLRGMIKGSIPPGVPSSHIHFKLSRRFPVDQWALARDFYIVEAGGEIEEENAAE